MLIINSRGKIEKVDFLTRDIRNFIANLSFNRIISSFTCDQATGKYLDNLSNIYGIVRKDCQSDDQFRGEIHNFIMK